MGRFVGSLMAIVGVVALAGCWLSATDDGEPLDPDAALVRAVDPYLRERVLLRLGAWPEGERLDRDALERLRLGAADERWAQLKYSYPQAERPEVEFDGYLHPDELYPAVHRCLVESGVRSEFSHSGGIRWEISSEEDAIATYVCSTRYQREPVSGLTDEQVAYLFDYMVQFQAPCFAGLGLVVPPGPSREEFVAAWPTPGWSPELALSATSQSFSEQVRESCPSLSW